MANGRSTTIVVAVAGIAATALVGLAGTTASWLNARGDRTAQRGLARDQRTYDRRAAVYLDAIDLVEDQKQSWDKYGQPYFNAWRSGEKIPYRCCATRRLTTRLRVFGSTKAFETFQKAEALNGNFSYASDRVPGGTEYLVPVKPGKKLLDEPRLDKAFYDNLKRFNAQVNRFEEIVHGELGF